MTDGRFVRMVLVGDRPTGSFAGEIWQTGISMVDQDSGGVFPGAVKGALPSFPTIVQGDSTLDATWRTDWAWEGTGKFDRTMQTALANHALTFWNAIKGLAPLDSYLREVRLSALFKDVDGKWKVINGANVFSLVAPVAGTGVLSSQLPAQLAITASLRSGARGPAGRGRMFLPLNGPNSASGLIGGGAKDTVGNATKALVQNIRAAGPLAAIVNRAGSTYSDIDDVQVGNFYDTQRRRENAKDEVYTSYTPTLT